jgi:hypothetical protein
MSALPSFPPPEPRVESRSAALAQLRHQLVQRFPGAVPAMDVARSPHDLRDRANHASEAARQRLLELQRASFLWVEVPVGRGGLSWLAAWTLLRLADDPLGRPALWIDTHNTLTPGDLLDLEGRLVVVRPADPHEAHVAADIALRAGSFSLVALEMHRALHPNPLARLARLAGARRAGSGVHAKPGVPASTDHEGEAHTPLIVWGEPPPFVSPPSGIPRIAFTDATAALLADPRVIPPAAPSQMSPEHEPPQEQPHDHAPADDLEWRAPHTTDRLRPLDRAADRRPSPRQWTVAGGDVVDPSSNSSPYGEREPDDDAPFPFARSRRRSSAPR